MKTKSIIRYYCKSTRTAKIKGLNTPCVNEYVEELELSYTDGGNEKWYSHFGEQFIHFLTSNIHFTYNPAIPFLGFYPRKAKAYTLTKTCTCF